jgi:hypothetical protein
MVMMKLMMSLSSKKRSSNLEVWPCPVFVKYTLVFAIKARKKHGKTSVMVVEKCSDLTASREPGQRSVSVDLPGQNVM